ncbi:MAG: hypothetical protein IKP95_05370 [Ruminococcus sp.]|nr:hypothetical protein [Ruminococcus sp.]
MGLDIYAGTMTRYYGRNWLTSVQQWGIKNGMQVNIVRPEGQGDETLASPEEITEGVAGWKDWFLGQIGGELSEPVNWSEDHDTTPYYTDKPDWDAVEALMLYAAAKWMGVPLPEKVKKGFNVYEHPIYKEFMEKKQGAVSLFDSDCWWLPLKDSFMIPCPLPTNQQKMLATVGMLSMELDAINDIEWHADKETIIGWRETEGYPDDALYSKDKGVEFLEKHEEYDTVSLAKLAFSILRQAADFALEHGVCVIYDY